MEVWLDDAVALVARLEDADARRLEWSDEPVRERDAGVEPRTGAPTCVLLGHGHYARTCVLPTLSEALDVVAVHDIDPRALGVHTRAWARDTAGAPRPGKGADVWWIAGYHGGHAELAMRALEEGAVAVVEKPLVTTHAQLDALLEVMRANPRARVHTGFHRRHGRWRAWLERDLGVGRGAPCDVFAIVHKTPLPPHHWYRWPASGGAMVANGCHWLDEFLGLNPGARVVEVDTREDALGRLTSRVELDNGALFTLSMSPRGSSRLGVRELVEYRVEGCSARLVDTRRYTSESGEGVLRDEALDKHEPYALMVRAIAAAIRSGRGGEGADEIERTWRAVLTASS